MRSPFRFRDLRISRKLAVVITAHLTHAVVLFLLTTYGLRAVDSSRAYVAGEALWSKAQKDAVLHLVTFAEHRTPSELQAYQEQINVTLGDRQARLELEKPRPNLTLVREGFLRGGNHPDDIDNMVWLFRTFRRDPHIEQAVDAWSRADENITELIALAGDLQAATLVAGPGPRPATQNTVDSILAVNARLTVLEKQFSTSLGDGARYIRNVVVVVTLGSTVLFVGAALLISSVVARQLTRSTRAINDAAIHMAGGDLDTRVEVHGQDEFAAVGRAFNDMAERLQEVSLDLRSRADALRVSLEEFKLVAEQAPIGIFRINAVGTIEYANRKWGEIAGCDYRDFLAVRRAVHPEDQPRLSVSWRQAFAAHTEFRDAIRYVHQDGTVVECATRATPVLDREGSLVGFVGILEDIGERRRGEEAVRQTERQQEELDALRALENFRVQFINTAAHELRTPLMPMRAQIHRLRSEPLSGSPEEKRSLVILERNINRIALLVEDFLQAAQIQGGGLKLRPRNSNLKRVIQKVVDAHERRAAERKIDLQLEVLGDVTLWCDSERIAQVMHSLVDNALKFSSPGSRVHIEAIGSADSVEVRVMDQGIGIHRDDLGRLFSPFAQVHDPRQITEPGSGLGLYVSKAIIELHQGVMGVESPGLGRGSTFWFRIPKTPPNPRSPPDGENA